MNEISYELIDISLQIKNIIFDNITNLIKEIENICYTSNNKLVTFHENISIQSELNQNNQDDCIEKYNFQCQPINLRGELHIKGCEIVDIIINYNQQLISLCDLWEQYISQEKHKLLHQNIDLQTVVRQILWNNGNPLYIHCTTPKEVYDLQMLYGRNNVYINNLKPDVLQHPDCCWKIAGKNSCYKLVVDIDTSYKMTLMWVILDKNDLTPQQMKYYCTLRDLKDKILLYNQCNIDNE